MMSWVKRTTVSRFYRSVMGSCGGRGECSVIGFQYFSEPRFLVCGLYTCFPVSFSCLKMGQDGSRALGLGIYLPPAQSGA